MAKIPIVVTGNAFESVSRKHEKLVMWQKHELRVLLGVYGQGVASGLWRDYRLSAGDKRQAALFTIHRHAHEHALFRVEKYQKPLLYQLRDAQGKVLRRGENLSALLRYFSARQLKLAK